MVQILQFSIKAAFISNTKSCDFYKAENPTHNEQYGFQLKSWEC